MRIGRRNQEPTDTKKKILTTAKDKIAQITTPDETARGGKETNPINNLEDLLNIDFLAMQDGKTSDQGEHPFDLSFVHSQVADYPDYSEDELPIQKRARHLNSDDGEEMSVIASDSSFNDKLREAEFLDDSDADSQ